jgi:hypothetical protein
MKLNRRGKIVVTVLIIAVIWWLFDVTTPDQCKVPIDEMSNFCKDLLYP